MSKVARRLEVPGRRPAPKLVRLERESVGDDRVQEKEARGLPAGLLGQLPVGTLLLLRVPGHDGAVAIASSPERAAEGRQAGLVVFDPTEWQALVTAVESDRVWPSDLRELCERKARAPQYVLDLDAALAGARAEAPQGWSVGRVLDRVGAQLSAVA